MARKAEAVVATEFVGVATPVAAGFGTEGFEVTGVIPGADICSDTSVALAWAKAKGSVAETPAGFLIRSCSRSARLTALGLIAVSLATGRPKRA